MNFRAQVSTSCRNPLPSSSALNMGATGSSKTLVLFTTLHTITFQNTVFFTKVITKNYNKGLKRWGFLCRCIWLKISWHEVGNIIWLSMWSEPQYYNFAPLEAFIGTSHSHVSPNVFCFQGNFRSLLYTQK